MFIFGRYPTTLLLSSNLTFHLFFLPILFGFSLFRPIGANCSHQLFFINRSANTDLSFQLIENTKQCNDQFGLLDLNDALEPCADFLSVELTPISIFPVGKNILPYVQLNITITTLLPIDQFFLRFRCIYAPNSDDYLCHNHSIQMTKWGTMIWPCRKFQLDYPAQLQFSYTCFRLFSLSQYELELFVRIHGLFCRRNILLTIPLERHLDPKIDYFYTGNLRGSDTLLQQHASITEWAPLLALDTSFNDSIDVHLHPVDWLLRDPSTLSLSQIFPSSNTTEGRSSFSYRWRWREVDAGGYSLYAYRQREDCRLSCGAEGDGGRTCRVCPHTALNISISAAKYSDSRRTSLFLVSAAKYAALALFVLLLILLVVLLMTFFYNRVLKPRASALLPPRPVELGSRCPSVLVLYTDDCPVHSDAVLALCRMLEESANAKCLVDQWEFAANPTLRPSVWLAEKLAECDFILIIFSACSARVLAGEQLIQRRHFPDLFNAGVGFVVAKIREIASSEGVSLPSPQQINHRLPKESKPACTDPSARASLPSQSLSNFICTRFAYSSPSVVPPFFDSSQFGGSLVLPDQIGRLIARLHCLDSSVDATASTSVSQNFLHEADLSAFNAALEEFQRFVETNEKWMDERFTREETHEEDEEAEERKYGRKEREKDNGLPPNGRSKLDKKAMAEFPGERIPTLAEQQQIAERYGLLDVDADDEERKEGGRKESSVEITALRRYQLIMDEEDENG